MKNILIALTMAFAMVAAGCQNNPVKTPRGTFYKLDADVTAADAAVLTYVQYPDCVTTANVLPCSRADIRARLAQATRALSHAMDAYSATVRDPNFTAGGLSAASVAVNNALLALTTILAEVGVHP